MKVYWHICYELCLIHLQPYRQLIAIEVKAKSGTMMYVYQVPKSVLMYVQGVLTIPTEEAPSMIEVSRQNNSN